MGIKAVLNIFIILLIYSILEVQSSITFNDQGWNTEGSSNSTFVFINKIPSRIPWGLTAKLSGYYHE